MKKFYLFNIFLLINILTFAQIPTTGLVGYYPFNGNANDASGNNNNGTVFGALLVKDRFDIANSAFQIYNNTNPSDKGIIVNNFNIDFNNITVSCWIKDSSNDNISRRFITHNWEGNGVFVLFTESNKLNANIRTNSGHSSTCSTNEILKNKWYHLVMTYDSLDLKMYLNGVLNGTISINSNLISSIEDLKIGGITNNWGFQGEIDDIRIYNRALNVTEINSIYLEMPCSNVEVNDTITYNVADINFSDFQSITYFNNTDTLQTQIGGCDSIVHRYSKFIYHPTYCSVTDTLIIDVLISGLTQPNNINTIKVYPNPTKDIVFINTGNYNNMSNYKLIIENVMGQTIYQTLFNQPLFQIDISQFGNYGTYFLKIFDNNNNNIVIKKIILN